MKVDLHVHSTMSKKPNEWVLRKLGAQESYTDPLDVYKIAKSRGMDAVTITDHNTIEGALAIAHLPDTFISCEYTTYFPADRCKVHIVCYDITPQQHERLQQVRQNIYDIAQYLKQENILHTVAHPFYSPNFKFTLEHFEELLQLFDCWEINGAKDAWVNSYLQLILNTAQPAHILTGGSDDHSGLTIGHTYTEVRGANNPAEFLEGVRAGKTVIETDTCTPHTLAWNVYSIGWQWLKENNIVNGYGGVIDKYLVSPEIQTGTSFAKRIWLNTKAMSPENWGRFMALSFINREFEKVDMSSVEHLSVSRQWTHMMETIINKYLLKLGNRILEEAMRKRPLNVFSNLGMPLALYLLLSPLLVSFTSFASQRKLCSEALRRYCPQETQSAKVAKFTDTFGSVDGVAKTLDEQLEEALRTGKDYTVISCVGQNNRRGLKLFQPVGMMDAPGYQQQKLCLPPFMKMLDYCFEQQFTLIQAATPGPVGLAGLAIARVLQLPFHAVYHTQVPEYIGKMTEDGFLEQLSKRYVMWFYDSADTVFTPSEHTREYLIKNGLNPEKTKAYPRGVDTALFHPSKRSDYWETRWEVPPGTMKALYVGRVSKEKNIQILANSFRALTKKIRVESKNGDRARICLLVVGAGDYLSDMKQECAGYPVIFTGELHGEELATAFASADFLVFPSATDTYGRVVVEAMASGIPCIVTDVGGPKESVIHGRNGLVIKSDDEEALHEAMRSMAFSHNIKEMGLEARKQTGEMAFTKAFSRYWALYAA